MPQWIGIHDLAPVRKHDPLKLYTSANMNEFQFLEQFPFHASLHCNSYSFYLNSLIFLQLLSSWKTTIHPLRPQTNIT